MTSLGLMVVSTIIELAAKMPLWVIMLTIAIFWVGVLVEALFDAILKLAEGVAKAADEISKVE